MESSLLMKLFGVLEATAGQTEGRALAEIAAEVGLAKPTAHRILKELIAMGYMERVGSGVYRQTHQIRRLVSTGGDRRLTRAAEEPLRDLWEATGETVNLGVLRLGRVAYLSVIESRQSLRRTVSPNMTDPFACTALGRSIAAHLPETRLAYLLKTTPLEKRTPNTIVDHAELKRLFESVRAKGYALEEGETDLGVMCIGAAVFDQIAVAGAISLSAPTVRADVKRRTEWISLICKAAEKITDRLRKSEGD